MSNNQSRYIYFIMFPPFDIPDEIGHFRRAFEVSYGNVFSEKNDLGQGINYLPCNNVAEYILSNENKIGYKDLPDLYECKIDYDNWCYVVNKNQALYSPLSYIGQATGIFIGRALTDRMLVVYNFARFFNMLLSLILVVAAYFVMPNNRNIILCIACMPCFMAEMVSVSADSLLNSTSLFFVAYILYLENQGGINKTQFAVLTVSAILISLSKVVYFPIVFFMTIISVDKFDVDITKGKIKKYTACAVPILLGIIWCLLASTYLGNSHPGADAREQFLFVLHNPVRYMWIMVKSIVKNTPYFIVGIVQVFTVLMQMKWPVKLILSLLAVVYILNFIYMLYYGSGEGKSGDKSSGKIIVAIIIMEIVLIFSAEYMQWTEVGASEVDGVQGRYFLPFMVFIAFLLIKGKRPRRCANHYIASISFNEKLFMGTILMINSVFLLSAVLLWF